MRGQIVFQDLKAGGGFEGIFAFLDNNMLIEIVTTEKSRDQACSWDTKYRGNQWGLVKCHYSLLGDFKNGDKNVKTFLKGEQILPL